MLWGFGHMCRGLGKQRGARAKTLNPKPQELLALQQLGASRADALAAWTSSGGELVPGHPRSVGFRV